MGNATSYQRHHIFWGVVLLLLIPPSNKVNGWNIPFWGGEKPAQTSPDEVFGVRVDEAPVNVPNMITVAAPIIGPVDAPHLRYIPSYFSNQIPPKLKQLFPTIISTFRSARLNLFKFLWYKPPVGIVVAWTSLRLVENLYGIFRPPPPSSGEEALVDAEGKVRGAMNSLIPNKGKFTPWGSLGTKYSAKVEIQQIHKHRRKRKSKVRRGRSFDLDKGDRSYNNFGGVEAVRVRACQEGLRSALAVTSSRLNGSDPNLSKGSLFGDKGDKGGSETAPTEQAMIEYSKDMGIALGALQLSCPPKGSREYFVEQSAEALSALSKYIAPSNDGESTASIHEQNVRLLLKHSSKLIELRTLDALLRTLRDRHLIVATRLRRTREYWKWRVKFSGGTLGRFFHKLGQKAMTVFPLMEVDDFRDRNQKEFELATATWEREVDWLGKVERILLQSPEELEVSDLLSVVGNGKPKNTSWRISSFLKEGEDSDASYKPKLIESMQLFLQPQNRIWLRLAEQWNKMARETIKDSLDGTISVSFTSMEGSGGHNGSEDREDETKASSAYAESLFLERWAAYDNKTSNANSWLTVLSLVDFSASTKRAGERRSDLATKIKRYDGSLRIPSSALLIAGANMLHDKIVAPNKQEIVDFVKGISAALWGILEFRFYNPMKDIVLDLLNRRPRMVDPFALLNEQTSLDNMLLDLGVGDGTRETRAVALAAASRMYEQEVAGGAVRGIVRGKVAQLMLIQIQQLKADLLQAMDTIDNLVDANRLNVQLVASIPAGLIIFFGSRALYLFWSNIRMKDFRLPQDVHAEMSDYLKKVEECLILANHELDMPRARSSAEGAASPIARAGAETCLKPKEMGNLLLLLHSYLNLLDYMSPPFPNKQCDSIHQSIQNLLVQGQMSTARQLELLKVIQSKHAGLLKSL
ncbi:hypothetical protein ACHAWF_006071 [Thalassiosira exigua]